MNDLLRRIGRLPADRVALIGTSVACLLVLGSFVVAAVAGPVRLSHVAAALTFLLVVAVGLYASRLGAPGRSA